MDYIATFFSHFGAIRFKKNMEKKLDNIILMPVPRKFSSSCGTCVKFSTDNIEDIDFSKNIELDRIIVLEE